MTGSAHLTIEPSGNDFIVSWIGGYPPFQLQESPSLGAPSWANIGSVTMRHQQIILNNKPMGFFRLMEAVPLLDATLTETTVTFNWSIPEL